MRFTPALAAAGIVQRAPGAILIVQIATSASARAAHELRHRQGCQGCQRPRRSTAANRQDRRKDVDIHEGFSCASTIHQNMPFGYTRVSNIHMSLISIPYCEECGEAQCSSGEYSEWLHGPNVASRMRAFQRFVGGREEMSASPG